MSDTNLRLQVVLSAVDKITRPFRNARDGSKELAAALKASKDDLKSLNEQAGRIDGFRKTRSQLAITEKIWPVPGRRLPRWRSSLPQRIALPRSRPGCLSRQRAAPASCRRPITGCACPCSASVRR